MNSRIYKYFFTLLILSVIFSLPLLAQNWPQYYGNDETQDPIFDNSSVWHKNMELICPFDTKGPVFQAGAYAEYFNFANINYDSGSESGYFIIINTLFFNFKGTGDGTEKEMKENFLGISRIQLIDVTNPRKPNIALEIFVKKAPYLDTANSMGYNNRDYYYPLTHTAHWKDLNDKNGHTYLAVNVNDDNGVLVSDPDENVDGDEIFSQVLILDLSQALTKVKQGSGDKRIIINDTKSRNSAYLVGEDYTSDVYIGFIPRDDQYFVREWQVDHDFSPPRLKPKRFTGFHTFTCDFETGVLALNPLHYSELDCEIINGKAENCQYKSYVDCYFMSSIPKHENYDSETEFVVPARIETSNGTPVNVDVSIEGKSFPIRPHEAHARAAKQWNDLSGDFNYDQNGKPLIEKDKILLHVASFGNARNKTGITSLGGAMTYEIDLSADTNKAVVAQLQYWGYDSDRDSPETRFFDSASDNFNSVWNDRPGHTFNNVFINNKTNLFITVDELASPFVLLKNGYTEPELKVNCDNQSYKNFGFQKIWGFSSGPPDPECNEDYYEDNRRFGNYFKIWGSDNKHKKIVGKKNNPNNDFPENENPIGSYDTHELWPTSPAGNAPFYSLNGKNSALNNDEILSFRVGDYQLEPGKDTTTKKQPGLNSCHHFNTIYEVTGLLPDDENDQYRIRRELYTSNFVSGLRVIDLKDFIREGNDDNSNERTYSDQQVYERAYFDFNPTLLYYIDLQGNSKDRYFSMLKNWGGSDEDFRDQLWKGLPNYFMGIWDVLPDAYFKKFEKDRPDFHPDESFVYAMGVNAHQAPWLQNGGFLILRYFRDEIGGTIQGYSGDDNNMSFQEINLQGEFRVQRDVIIHKDAIVTLLPGVYDESKNGNSQSGIFKTSAFNAGDNGLRSVIVNGTLNISSTSVSPYSTSITINVPIVVKEGGKLVIHKIRDNKSEPVVFNENITIEPGGNLEIKEESNVVFNNIVLEPDLKVYLEQNIPNPFSTHTTINYTLINPGFVKITIFDLLGNEIAQIENSYKSSGQHSINYKNKNLKSGTYFYRLEFSGQVETKIMQVVR